MTSTSSELNSIVTPAIMRRIRVPLPAGPGPKQSIRSPSRSLKESALQVVPGDGCVQA